jgi:hypothetical protein
MNQSEISALWSEIITQRGLQTTVDLISNPPKILSSWIEGPTSKDGQTKIWFRKLIFSTNPFPQIVSIYEFSGSSRFEIHYYDKSISAEKQYESSLLEAQKKTDEKLQAAGYFLVIDEK